MGVFISYPDGVVARWSCGPFDYVVACEGARTDRGVGEQGQTARHHATWGDHEYGAGFAGRQDFCRRRPACSWCPGRAGFFRTVSDPDGLAIQRHVE